MNNNIDSNGVVRQRTLTTADLVASANGPERRTEDRDGSRNDADAGTAPLFEEHIAGDFRSRWSVVQQGFVDDPQRAVREGDELVAQVIKSLAETFAQQRATLEGERSSTEDLRLALRRYRSFFERLLSV